MDPRGKKDSKVCERMCQILPILDNDKVAQLKCVQLCTLGECYKRQIVCELSHSCRSHHRGRIAVSAVCE